MLSATIRPRVGNEERRSILQSANKRVDNSRAMEASAETMSEDEGTTDVVADCGHDQPKVLSGSVVASVWLAVGIAVLVIGLGLPEVELGLPEVDVTLGAFGRLVP